MKSKSLIFNDCKLSGRASGHVKGAINIPPEALLSEALVLNKADKDTKLILCCRTGSPSNMDINILQQEGFTNLVNGINVSRVNKNA